MKISRHENFAVSRSRPKNREIKMPRKTILELDREIKMPRNSHFSLDREIRIARNAIFNKKNREIKMTAKFSCREIFMQ